MSQDHSTAPATEKVLATIGDSELAARYPERTHFISADNPGRFSKTKPRVTAVKCQKRRKAKRKRAKRSSVSRALIAERGATRR